MYDQEMIYECIFVKRLNRFVATVVLNGEENDVHVKNTGRCKELLIPGSIGYLVKSENAKRKYLYDLVAIYKGDDLVNFDSQIPNAVVADYIMSGKLFTNIVKVQREVTYQKSRFDIYVERINEEGNLEKIFVEVKGVTLYEEEMAMFPDAPTVRGVKHVEELVAACLDGYKSYIFFLVQTEKVNSFSPNRAIDPKFTDSLKQANLNGVEILCFNTHVTPSSLKIKDQVKVII